MPESRRSDQWVRPLEGVTGEDVADVGGKNASLGEMIGALSERGIRVPRGFATTAAAHRRFVEHNELGARIDEQIKALHDEGASLEEVGRSLRADFERGRRRTVGFCGQAPSDDPGFTRVLVEAGIDSISVSPDGFLAAKREVAAAEAALHRGAGSARRAG